MSILKEGFGCNDEDLFEKCEFNMLTHKAIKLVNLDTAAPSIDTYYLFRRRICKDTTPNVHLITSSNIQRGTLSNVHLNRCHFRIAIFCKRQLRTKRSRMCMQTALTKVPAIVNSHSHMKI